MGGLFRRRAVAGDRRARLRRRMGGALFVPARGAGRARDAPDEVLRSAAASARHGFDWLHCAPYGKTPARIAAKPAEPTRKGLTLKQFAEQRDGDRGLTTGDEADIL